MFRVIAIASVSLQIKEIGLVLPTGRMNMLFSKTHSFKSLFALAVEHAISLFQLTSDNDPAASIRKVKTCRNESIKICA